MQNAKWGTKGRRNRGRRTTMRARWCGAISLGFLTPIPSDRGHTLVAIRRSRRRFNFMETETTLIETNAIQATLAAAARSPEIPEAMDLYGFLIGSWTLDVVGYADD